MGGSTFWRAVHDNGWDTCVRSNDDGTFSGWAENPSTIGPEFREASADLARAAALASLKEQTGHDRCAPACVGWYVKVYTKGVAAAMEESDRPKTRKRSSER